MFGGCRSLISAPKLPATTLANNCYCDMFDYCESLINAPKLPATTLADYCYASMFIQCTSLTTAPTLPATTLSVGCYYGMFESCESLSNAPELCATTLTEYCYQNMFAGCWNLNQIKLCATDISAEMCLDNWLNDVAKTGIIMKDIMMLDLPVDSASGVPVGWTTRNIQPYIPSNPYLTTLIRSDGTIHFEPCMYDHINYNKYATVLYSTDSGITWVTNENTNQIEINVHNGDVIFWKCDLTEAKNYIIENDASDDKDYNIGSF